MTDRVGAGYPVVVPRFYAWPERAPLRLGLQPRLASWNAAGHPDQIRLSAALTDAACVLMPAMENLEGPVPLRLDVGLSTSIPLLDEHDLDNYAFPLAAHLTVLSGRSFCSIWCTKQHESSSFVRVEPAVTITEPPSGGVRFDVTTDRSALSTGYKQQIHDQLRHATALPDGPVAMQIAFTVGARRNWLNLWKPTIDAMEQILGRSQPERQWHPRDGRIVELGLHLAVEPKLGNDTRIVIRRRLQPLNGPRPDASTHHATAVSPFAKVSVWRRAREAWPG